MVAFLALLEPVHVKILPATNGGAHDSLSHKVRVTVATGTTVFQIALAIWVEREGEDRERGTERGERGREGRERKRGERERERERVCVWERENNSIDNATTSRVLRLCTVTKFH